MAKVETKKKTNMKKTKRFPNKTVFNKDANTLIIVESPNKIKSLEKYLGKDYMVLASVGHIVRLPYSGKYRFGTEPGVWDPDWKLDSKKENIVTDLKKATSMVDEVLIATDPDREGEAIAQNLVDFLRIKNKHKRIRFNEITEEAVKRAIQDPTEVDQGLVNAQIARRILDRVIGFQLSSLLRKKLKNNPMPPSAGRVQSVALELVVEREKLIDAFVPEEFYSVEAIITDDIKASLYYPDKKENKEWVLPKDVESIKKQLKGSLKVVDVKTSERNDAKLTPLKLSALYRRCDSMYGMSAAAVRRASQRLYEGFGDGGLISYPRTDSTRMSDTFVKKAKAYLTKKFTSKYVSDVIKGVPGAQDAHEAIRPTDVSLTPSKAKALFSLDDSLYKVYKLIYEHTLSSIMVVPRREIIRYELQEGKLSFKMTSSKVIFDGYFKLTGYEKSKELPKYKKGEQIKVVDYEINPHETKPPARYNDGSLIAALEENGVGRPSTFQATVDILKTRAYVNLKGKSLVPTDYGKLVYYKLQEAAPKILDIKYTANLETLLDKIAEGKKDYKKMLDEFWTSFHKEVIEAESKLVHTSILSIPVGKPCPECGKALIIKRNKINSQRFFGCSGFPDCKYTESDPTQRKTFFRRWKK